MCLRQTSPSLVLISEELSLLKLAFFVALFKKREEEISAEKQFELLFFIQIRPFSGLGMVAKVHQVSVKTREGIVHPVQGFQNTSRWIIICNAGVIPLQMILRWQAFARV